MGGNYLDREKTALLKTGKGQGRFYNKVYNRTFGRGWAHCSASGCAVNKSKHWLAAVFKCHRPYDVRTHYAHRGYLLPHKLVDKEIVSGKKKWFPKLKRNPSFASFPQGPTSPSPRTSPAKCKVLCPE